MIDDFIQRITDDIYAGYEDYDFHSCKYVADNLIELISNVVPDFDYTINLNCFTDKFFKGRDDKSISSQESPKNDTFDMDK